MLNSLIKICQFERKKYQLMNNRRLKILLLGGTGAMGAHLSKILKNQGEDVYVTTRRERRGEGITYIQGNAHETVFLRELLQKYQFDVLVDFMIYNTSEFADRANLLLSSVGQYVFLSSSRVYADSETLITEDSPRLLDVCKDEEYLKTDEYALSKARQEDILHKSRKKTWTIIRPYITYSEIRLQLGVLEKELWLYRAMHGRTIVFSKDIAEKTTTLTYGYDVALGIASIIGRESALGEVFHITSDESHTWMEILELYLDVVERKTSKRPKLLLLDKSIHLKCAGAKWQVVVDRYYNRRFDNSKIRQYIDTSQFKQTKYGLTSCLESFLHDPQFRNIGWGAQAIYDRITGEWVSLNEISMMKDRLKYLLRRTVLPKK